MSDASNDTSGVGFPPPLLYAGGFAVGYGAHRLLPIRLWPTPTTLESVLGWGLLIAGVLLAASAAYLFRRAGTTPNPAKPTSALVIWGPYRFTRNPMYVGMATLYCGGPLLLNDPWPLAVLPLVMPLAQRRVIAPAEAHLERPFAAVCRAYKARLRVPGRRQVLPLLGGGGPRRARSERAPGVAAEVAPPADRLVGRRDRAAPRGTQRGRAARNPRRGAARIRVRDRRPGVRARGPQAAGRPVRGWAGPHLRQGLEGAHRARGSARVGRGGVVRTRDPPAPRPREGTRACVSQCPRHAPVPGERVDDHQAGGPARGADEARDAAHAAAHVRDTPARGRRGPARRPGNARACGPRHHAAVHARRPRLPADRAQDVSSPGLSRPVSRAFVKEDSGEPGPRRNYGLPPRDDPGFDAAAAEALLEAARAGETASEIGRAHV